MTKERKPTDAQAKYLLTAFVRAKRQHEPYNEDFIGYVAGPYGPTVKVHANCVAAGWVGENLRITEAGANAIGRSLFVSTDEITDLEHLKARARKSSEEQNNALTSATVEDFAAINEPDPLPVPGKYRDYEDEGDGLAWVPDNEENNGTTDNKSPEEGPENTVTAPTFSHTINDETPIFSGLKETETPGKHSHAVAKGTDAQNLKTTPRVASVVPLPVQRTEEPTTQTATEEPTMYLYTAVAEFRDSYGNWLPLFMDDLPVRTYEYDTFDRQYALDSITADIMNRAGGHDKIRKGHDVWRVRVWRGAERTPVPTITGMWHDNGKTCFVIDNEAPVSAEV